jgi:hypothetical protein
MIVSRSETSRPRRVLSLARALRSFCASSLSSTMRASSRIGSGSDRDAGEEHAGNHRTDPGTNTCSDQASGVVASLRARPDGAPRGLM